MSALDTSRVVAIVGAGTMGAGIAQVAAAAGHRVVLFDAMDGAAARGFARLAEGIQTQVARGRIAGGDATALLGRISVAGALNDLSEASMVVEAIVEDLAIKRKLFASLEDVVAPDAILATNTSSLSITSIARDLRSADRVVGMHFFNPAPVMRLVEVVSGVATGADVASAVFETAKAWGKIPVHAKSTPGFIVNRVARAYYAEPLRLYEEQVADPATLDALMTEGAGFRMGPFALMDLIGLDVNYAVSVSVFDAFYGEPRFRPSAVQRELVNAGRLGRKSGRGFFTYGQGAVQPQPATSPVPAGLEAIDAATPIGDEIGGARIMPSDGRTAAEVARALGRPVIVHDLVAQPGGTRVGFAASPDATGAAVDAFVAALAARGQRATRLPDWPGLVALRTVAMIANEAFEAVLQGVAAEDGIDDAMRHGVNYPKGPVAWAREIGLDRILSVLDAIHALTGDPRYRASFGLRRAASITPHDERSRP